MKKINLFLVAGIFSGLFVSEAFANRYGECRDACFSLSGKPHEKSTEAGACSTGCSAAHWTGKKKARKECDSSYGNYTLIKRCKNAVDRY